MIVPPTTENLRRAAELLARGELVGLPTETVYGLAGDAFNATAVARIFAAKERPTFDPLIVHVAPIPPAQSAIDVLAAREVIDAAALDATARARAEALMRAFWPGPLTLVLPRHARVPDLVTSGLPTVAVRVPHHPVALALLAERETPLAAPSANRFGRISPTSARDVEAELGDALALILDGGPCAIGVESTVVAIAPGGELRLLRPGGTPIEELERVTGARPILTRAPVEGAPPSPGMLAGHYAPAKRLILLGGPAGDPGDASLRGLELPARVGLLAQSGDAAERAASFARATGREVEARVLSATGNLEEAARNLFAGLRALDESAASLLFAEPCTVERGLGHAIRDRLRRASR
ncbi:MAG TPA: L-threonylcarbamoyladenylate synthase [Polyangia bacterium]|nr:L-threonylcarbamoyladenylate synthase [Polyangia bacterium]